jgi:hypothetical protein
MVSRDTTIHIVAVTIALIVLAVATDSNLATGPMATAAVLLFYGLVLGGAHLYLALRDKDGMIPVESRWRYLAMLTVLLGVGAVIIYEGERTIATLKLESIGVGIIIFTLLVYFIVESAASYRALRSKGDQ